MKLIKLFLCIVLLLMFFFLGFKLGCNRSLALSEIQTNTYQIYKSISDNHKGSEETFEELENLFYQLLSMLYFDAGKSGFQYNYHETEKLILESLQREFCLCNQRNLNIDTSEFLESHLSVCACLINSSEPGTDEQNKKIACLAVMLKYAKNINQQVFKDFLKSHMNCSYFSLLIESLKEIDAIEDGVETAL